MNRHLHERSPQTPAGEQSRTLGVESGASTIELMAMVPVVLFLMVIIAWAGQNMTVRQQIDQAARDAARVGALSHSEAQAAIRANDVLAAALGERFSDCTHTINAASIGTMDMARDGELIDIGTVDVAVDCAIRIGTLGSVLGGLAGDGNYRSTASEPIDSYRSRTENL